MWISQWTLLSTTVKTLGHVKRVRTAFKTTTTTKYLKNIVTLDFINGLRFDSSLKFKLSVCLSLCVSASIFYILFHFFYFLFSVRHLSVLRGHSVFSSPHNGQWPLTLKDIYTKPYPLQYFLFLILASVKWYWELYFPCASLPYLYCDFLLFMKECVSTCLLFPFS